MAKDNSLIDQRYVDMVGRYQKESDLKTKIQMKYRFIHWFSIKREDLTDAESEYLQTCICSVYDD